MPIAMPMSAFFSAGSALHGFTKFHVGHLFQFGARHGSGVVRYAEFPGNNSRGHGMVACNHNRAYAGVPRTRDRLFRFISGRVDHTDQACKD